MRSSKLGEVRLENIGIEPEDRTEDKLDKNALHHFKLYLHKLLCLIYHLAF